MLIYIVFPGYFYKIPGSGFFTKYPNKNIKKKHLFIVLIMVLGGKKYHSIDVKKSSEFPYYDSNNTLNNSILSIKEIQDQNNLRRNNINNLFSTDPEETQYYSFNKDPEETQYYSFNKDPEETQYFDSLPYDDDKQANEKYIRNYNDNFSNLSIPSINKIDGEESFFTSPNNNKNRCKESNYK